MLRTGENQNTVRKTYRSVTLFIVSPTWTGLRPNPGLRVDRLMTGRQFHGTVWSTIIYCCDSQAFYLFIYFAGCFRFL